MPRVIVTPPSSISVRVNQSTPKVVTGPTTFIGASNVQDQVNQAIAIASQAAITANTALASVDSKFDKTGGTITGNVNITNNLTVGNTIFAVTEIVDAGTF